MKVLHFEKMKPHEVKKLNIIRKLNDYKDHEKIKSLLKEFDKKQENDYFLTQANIKIGKIRSLDKKFSERNPYSYVGPSQLLPNHNKRKLTNSVRYKYNSSLSSSKLERKNKDSLNINKNHVIDNKSLKNYYNEIRQRIHEEKSRNEDRNKLLIEVPYGVRKSLINQENIFRKIMKEKRRKRIMEEKIKKKCNKDNINELLINKSKNFDKNNQQISILDKNMTEDYKYKGNLWNITLRNIPVNGVYEKKGYINVGDKYQPMYTLFNINNNFEYFNNPRYERNKTEENKIRNSKLYSILNEDNYNLKLKQNLQVLNSIKNLEINGKNLLEVEDKRESQIKGKKIIYNMQELDCLLFRHKDKSKTDREITDKEVKSTLDEIYEEKLFAKNYKKNDFFKNLNITSRYSNKMKI